MVRLHIYDVQLSIFRAITQWSVHLRRTLYNVFRTPPSLRLVHASHEPQSARDRTEPNLAHDDFAAQVTRWA